MQICLYLVGFKGCLLKLMNKPLLHKNLQINHFWEVINIKFNKQIIK